MASSWIKVEVITPDKPEVYQLAELLELDPDAVLGKLIRLWAWADQQTIDGNADCNAVSVTKSAIDRITFVKGFADAMLHTGWLALDGEKLIFPNFERHNGNSTKKRALTNRRVANLRDSQRIDTPNGNVQRVTKKTQKELPDEDEEEDKEKIKDPTLPPRGSEKTEKFNPMDTELPDWLPFDLWAEWVEFRKQLKKPIKTQKGIIETLYNLEVFRSNGHSPEAVIRQSIANEWQGLFEPKRGNDHSSVGNIDCEGAFYRLVLQGREPENEAEKKAQKQAQSAGLKRRNEVQAHSAWRGYLHQAYRETGEQPYTGG